jgi:hypothetical protein
MLKLFNSDSAYAALKLWERDLEHQPVFTVPDTLDIEELYYHYKGQFNLLGYKLKPEEFRDAVRYILSSICSGTFSRLNRIYYDQQVGQPLHSKILKEVLGNHYTEVMEFLIAEGLIKVLREEQLGKSRQYILGEVFDGSKKVLKNARNTLVKRKFVRSWKRHHLQKKKYYLRYALLIYWLQHKDFKIDTDAALAYFDRYVSRSKMMLAGQLVGKKLDQFSQMEKDLRSVLHKQLNDVAGGAVNVTIDRNHRLHSVVSTIREPIRHFISCGNESLVALDLKNSQPFHMGFLLQTKFWGTTASKITLRAICPEVYTLLEKEGVLTQIRDLIKGPSKADVLEFMQQTSNGTMYDLLVTRYGKETRKMKSRAAAKVAFMFIMNSPFRNIEAKKNKYYRLWSQDYPTVSALLQFVKSIGHFHMSTILQTLEAKMILDIVVNDFCNNYPDIPIFSVHDSLITLQSHSGHLQAVIERVYQQSLGEAPEVSIKELGPKTAFEELPSYTEKQMARNKWPFNLLKQSKKLRAK